MFFFLKIIVSAVIIAVITEISRRSPTYGGLIAALPLVSLLSLFWLTIQSETRAHLNQFTLGVLIGLPATAALLFAVYITMKQGAPVWLAILIGAATWLTFLCVQTWLQQVFH
ncbi:DUF3147 family protein [Shouchella lonarensis]|uniref:DUF3147 family protein n=1 Tax=Shouchella lonarensis TaxID=1464122 RepID=A0A1G6INI5_9BACI|nr:DUF3147 family protein [Shouchella lonarensis]SDC08059.1 hypothetical protein SAMN05421737_105122 [Shouchella lonarensis]